LGRGGFAALQLLFGLRKTRRQGWIALEPFEEL
jgi:hypothetical protein